jgi:hypothetical protein
MNRRSLLLGAAGLGTLALRRAVGAEAPTPQIITGRGVTYFDGRVRSPFAGLGTRGPQASNQLALDDAESRATIDPARRRITIVNTRVYPTKQIIADLTFLGTARAEDGARVPLAVHLKVEKKKAKISTDLHPHWTVRGKLTAAELEPFEVIYSDGATETVVASGDDLLRTATETKVSYRIAGALIEVQDNLEGHAPSLAAGAALADLSVGIGSKHLNTMFVRADLRSLDAGNAALAGLPPPVLLTRGAWQLRLTSLSRLLPQDTLRRDLFLLGIDRVPAVAAGLARGGVKKGESLVFTFRGGTGRVSWGGKEDDLPASLDVARTFLEFNFLGSLLAQQVARASATVGAAAAPHK